MQKKPFLLLFLLSFAVMPLSAQVGIPAEVQDEEPVIKKDGKTTIINTTTLASDVEGYAGPTPLRIYVKGDKVEKVEPLKNLETPKYFALIKRDLLNKWNGLTVKKAVTQEVDVVTGATYSSEAVIENVRRGLTHYQKQKK